MGMSIILNQRVYIPAQGGETLMGIIAISITTLLKEENMVVPKINYKDICSVSIRLGEFHGYDVADFLSLNTGTEFNGIEWFFDHCDAEYLIEQIDRVIEEKEFDENALEELRGIKEAVNKGLDNNAETFEVLLW